MIFWEQEDQRIENCFEQDYVAKTLKNTKKQGLAVIDSDGISKTINQEGALFEDFKRQPKSERQYRTEYMTDNYYPFKLQDKVRWKLGDIYTSLCRLTLV